MNSYYNRLLINSKEAIDCFVHLIGIFLSE